MDDFARLKDLSTIRPGYHLRGKLRPLPDGNLAIVQMSDIQPDGSISYSNLTRISADKVNPEYLIKSGDVLLTNRGHNNEGVLIETEVTDTVAASHFYRIRLEGPALRPEFLVWYLNQPTAQRELSRFKKSSSIPLLSREGVEALPIPVPPIEVQERIAATGALLQQEMEIMQKLGELRSKLISTQLLNKVSSYNNGASNV